MYNNNKQEETKNFEWKYKSECNQKYIMDELKSNLCKSAAYLCYLNKHNWSFMETDEGCEFARCFYDFVLKTGAMPQFPTSEMLAGRLGDDIVRSQYDKITSVKIALYKFVY